MGIKEFWMEFEHAGDEHSEYGAIDDFCNVTATLDDGRQYAFNIWTYGVLETAVSECRTSGEHLSGLYLPPPDLFVEKLDRPTIERALTHWLELEGRFPDHLACSEDD